VAGPVDLRDCFDVQRMRNAPGPAARPRRTRDRHMVRTESMAR